MKYSFMSFSCPKLSLDELLAAAKKYGYDGIEPRVDCQHKHGIEFAASAEERKTAKQKAKDAGVAFSCIATSCTFADPAKTSENIKTASDAISLAGDVGAPSIRVFGGQIPKEISREKAILIVSEALSSLAEHAQKCGVTVCMETHDNWCNPEHVAAVLKSVNHKFIAANWDIMHPVRREGVSIEKSFETLKPWIRHLHVHDGVMGDKDILRPIGQGIIDHGAAIRLLKTISYAGFISGEWINWKDPYEIHLPRELAAMKGYESDK
jgi:sugar phosphate isomerase/epimerase